MGDTTGTPLMQRKNQRPQSYFSIEIEKDTVIASLDDIEAFAYADTEFEAVNCLCGEIVDIYEDLKNDKENLGILPRKWIAFLEETIESR
jgi:hypothetical protein